MVRYRNRLLAIDTSQQLINKQETSRMQARMSPPSANCLIIGTVLFVLAQTIHATNTNENGLEEAHSNSNMMRKSIVFDLKTPKVFYCPQEKPSDSDKMIVKARPLDSLCEFQGQPKPKGKPSDCYNDVDETEFACDEKKRFMIRLDLASEFGESAGNDYGFDTDLDYILSKSPNGNKKKATANGKKF